MFCRSVVGVTHTGTPTPGPGRLQIRHVTSVFRSASLGVHSNRTGGCGYECGRLKAMSVRYSIRATGPALTGLSVRGLTAPSPW